MMRAMTRSLVLKYSFSWYMYILANRSIAPLSSQVLVKKLNTQAEDEALIQSKNAVQSIKTSTSGILVSKSQKISTATTNK